MKTIEKSILIEAHKEKVWNVLLEDELNREWFSQFSAGSHAETDWIEGHNVVFSDDSKRGIIGKIEAKQPYEYLSIAYDGLYDNGEEDFDSEEAQKVKGTFERYYLSEENGHTRLKIESDMPEEHFEYMSKAWDKALEKIESLSLT